MNHLPPGLLATMAIPEQQETGHPAMQYTTPQQVYAPADPTSQEDDENLGGKYKAPAQSGTVKRSPYTRLACFTCREKHQKCEGQRPVCLNCQKKGLQCVYREDRKKRNQETDYTLVDEKIRLTEELEQWKRKYSQLKKFVDDSVLSNMFAAQQLPYPPASPNMMAAMNLSAAHHHHGHYHHGSAAGMHSNMMPLHPSYAGLNTFQMMGMLSPHSGLPPYTPVSATLHAPPLNPPGASLNPVNPALSFSSTEGLVGPLPNGLVEINTLGGLTSLEGLDPETFNLAMSRIPTPIKLEKDGLSELSQDVLSTLKPKSPSVQDIPHDPFPLESIPAIPYFHDFESSQNMIPAILQSHHNSALFFQNPNGQM